MLDCRLISLNRINVVFEDYLYEVLPLPADSLAQLVKYQTGNQGPMFKSCIQIEGLCDAVPVCQNGVRDFAADFFKERNRSKQVTK